MKINPELQSQMDTSPKTHQVPAEGRTSFSSMVQSRTEHLKQQEIGQLMDYLSQQGNRLARFRSVRDLVKFKQTVKRLLKETTGGGLSLQKSRNFRMNGESSQLALVKAVDDKLVELTDEVMDDEQETIDLLGLIGEIKGLLVNLYM
ncbi:YaaR family protein [Barrientosiimonas marina]|uniref:YaaR family protein n=1 Tax=Lentibacillus kimchii TaxID=1542911 RepID=A0ABW2URM8_9BACI